MGKTSIEWTKYSWNPIRGTKGLWHCTHVSEGCRNCYAERFNIRMGGPAYEPEADTFRLDEKVLEQPLRWKEPKKIFVCSMTDLFHEEVPEDFILQVFAVMAIAERHTFQVLTKRPARMLEFMRVLSEKGPSRLLYNSVKGKWWKPGMGQLGPEDSISTKLKLPLDNVHLGVSVEDQKTADERIPMLLQTPAAVRWISAEPLLGPMHLKRWLGNVWFCNKCGFTTATIAENSRWDHACGYSLAKDHGVDWVVVGGESGPGARPLHPDWARSIRDQCQAAGVPFFFKQWGEWGPWSEPLRAGTRAATCSAHRDGTISDRPDGLGITMRRVGKASAGRLLDQREWSEFPK